jgi:hypothetical protein
MNSPETETIQRLLAEFKKIQDLLPTTDSAPDTIIKPLIITSNIDENSTTETERLLRLLKSDWLASVTGYFINHRSNSPYAKIDDEYKVQDLIYCLASSIVSDLQFEDPQQKNIGALAHTRVDFLSAKNQLFLEIKLANSSHSAKSVESELSEDIVKYGKQRIFNTLIFFVYCNEYSFPNPREFERGNTGSQSIQGHHFQTYCIVKP